jgi:urease accessory protein
MTTKTSRSAQFLIAVVFIPTLAQAHHAEFMLDRPFLQGMSMPLHGVDHMLVTLATGLIAAQIGGRALWAVPGIFSLSILAGGLLNILGISMPMVEYGILASIVICGALLAWGSRVSLFATLGVVALFAFFHGEALIANDGFVHNLPLFIVGCLISGVVLLSAGIGLGLLLSRVPRLPVYRYAGFAMLAAAVVVVSFPGANDCVIRLLER